MRPAPLSRRFGDTTPDAYERDGFVLAHNLVPPRVVQAAARGMDDVIAGRYETGRPPMKRDQRFLGDPHALVKFDQPHYSDRRIWDLVTHPAVGSAAAALTGADMVQVWAVQLLYKPPADTERGRVGWHTDHGHWHTIWEDHVFTCWVALSDVTAESGPVRFVRGSHKWRGGSEGNFDGIHLRPSDFRVPPGRVWEEAPAILEPGGASFHHWRTIHGSGPNLSDRPRRAFAIHLRTDRARIVPGSPERPYVGIVEDETLCPVIYRS